MARGAQKSQPTPTRQSNLSGSKNAKSVSRQAPEKTQNSSESLPRELQQRILNIFRDAFHASPEDATLLQEVKGHLYNRDFETAFGKGEYLRVYASRWSPSRALGYLQVFDDIHPYIFSTSLTDGSPLEKLRVLCIGGGAGGELVGFAAWLSYLQTGYGSSQAVSIDLVDIADWSEVINELERRITTPPELSKFASQAKKASNTALVDPASIHVDFERQDVFGMNDKSLSDLAQASTLVTFMFTLNELYSISIAKTQELLRKLSELMQPDALLLVVDSPGSYSTVSINGAEKKYPMQWLLHYTLLESAGSKEEAEKPLWEKVVSDDSRWFRLPPGLGYPIELENMRYQIHLFRKLGSP